MDGASGINGGSGSLYLLRSSSGSTGATSTDATSTGAADRAAQGASILSSVLKSGIAGAEGGTTDTSSISSIISSIKSGILTPKNNALGMNSAIVKAYSGVTPPASDTSSNSSSSLAKDFLTNAERPSENSIESLTAAPAAAKSAALKTASQGGISSLLATAKSDTAAIKAYSGLSKISSGKSPGSIIDIVT